MFDSASQIAAAIRAGQTTSTEVAKAHLAQIARHNPELNAIAIVLEQEALADAAARDQEAREGRFRGPLHGVPMTVKEQFWVKGTPSTLNSKRNTGFIAPSDAVIVTRLKDAGAVLMGKSNVAYNLLDYQVWGDIYPEGKNPYRLELSPGGSSGGSAAALASGMAAIELGGDFGGSVRIPANYCGVYGLKPTESTIPTHGMGPAPRQKGYIFHMGKPGPMARTIDDLETVWKIIRGPHPSDPAVAPIAWRDSSSKRLSDFRVKWVDGWPGYEAGSAVRALVRRAAETAAAGGARVTQATPPGDLHTRTLALYVRLFPQLIAQGLPWVIRLLIKRELDLTLLRGLTKFRGVLKRGFQLSYENYIETISMRRAIIAEWEAFLADADVLLCPMSYGPAFERRRIGTPIPGEHGPIVYIEYAWPYVACFNASGMPAMNLPMGLDTNGVPAGVQVAGGYWSEPDLLQFGRLMADRVKGFERPARY
ncbi:MAG: amidase family protein [Bryobacteraceae bacterium]